MTPAQAIRLAYSADVFSRALAMSLKSMNAYYVNDGLKQGKWWIDRAKKQS